MASFRDAYLAIQNAITRGEDEVAIAAIESGLDPNRHGKPPLHPPLHWAACRGRSKLVDRLLAAGARADHDAFTAKQNTYFATHGAGFAHHDRLVDRLVDAGAPVDLPVALVRRDAAGVRAIVAADPESLTRTVWHGRYSVMHYAADIRRPKLIPELVALGLPVDVPDASGHTALRYAARNQPALPVMKALLACGADVNHASKTGITALTSACRHTESLDSVRWLLKHGADPNLATKDGTTPLHKAVNNKAGAIAELLLAHGADPHRAGKKGETPIDVARRKKLTALVDRLAKSSR